MTKVLSVKQPHAFLMAIGVKPVENRTWKLPEKYKNERVLIHASGKADKCTWVSREVQNEMRKHIKEWGDSVFNKENLSAIIGSVRFVDCVINHPSIWAEKTMVRVDKVFYDPIIHNTKGCIKDFNGDIVQRKDSIFNWLAADPILFNRPILNVKGKLGFWEYSHPMCCPICAYPLHLQKTGDIITDAFCFNCKKDVLYYEKILCPYCGKVCLHDNSDVGVPNWGNPVHECEHCKEMILESEFNILK